MRWLPTLARSSSEPIEQASAQRQLAFGIYFPYSVRTELFPTTSQQATYLWTRRASRLKGIVPPKLHIHAAFSKPRTAGAGPFYFAAGAAPRRVQTVKRLFEIALSSLKNHRHNNGRPACTRRPCTPCHYSTLTVLCGVFSSLGSVSSSTPSLNVALALASSTVCGSSRVRWYLP